MKYMHFNSSCPYAGLANILAMNGYDTEDFIIAEETDLASHIRYDDKSGIFSSGFSLQSKKWFDMYLNPMGLNYVEKFVDKRELISILQPGMMLGIFVDDKRKHAIVCKDIYGERLTFINNKWENTDEPETIELTRDELILRIDDVNALGYVEACEKHNVDMKNDYLESLRVWRLLQKRITDFIRENRTYEEILANMNVIFRALLLDGLTMAHLRKDEPLIERLKILQKDFMSAVKERKTVRLADFMDENLLGEAFELIIQRVQNKIACY